MPSPTSPQPIPRAPLIAPVVLGCCHESPRCLLCNPPPEWPEPEVVEALVELYQHRAAPDEEVLLGFYGGPPPPAALWPEGIGGTVRVRPDLLTRGELDRLKRKDLRRVELDILTTDDRVQRGIGRRTRWSVVREQIEAIATAGISVGAVIAPGLPGTDYESALRDAEVMAPWVDTVRIHPVLVFAHARLREAHMDGRYKPLELGAAVTVCRALVDTFEAAGVQILRVGMQPGPDGLGRAVAGPRHTSLRELVESRRALDHLRSLLDANPIGAHIVIRCAPADETRTRGQGNQNVRTLRAEHGLKSLRISADPALPRGEWRASLVEPE